jgi:isoleucyl-tRNA synthetase
MSKSLGNVIPPEKLISQYGADIVRLWVSSEDYRNDVRIGIEMIKQISDSYRKIRNTFKFLLGNITDYSKEDAVSYGELSDIDRWILHRLYVLSQKVLEHYEKYEFHMVYRRILNFCAVELSSIYFDISKDILYVEAKSSKKRRANLMVLNEINECLVRLVSRCFPSPPRRYGSSWEGPIRFICRPTMSWMKASTILMWKPAWSRW